MPIPIRPQRHYPPLDSGAGLKSAAWLKSSALNLLFPRCCPVCGEIIIPKGALICPACMHKLSWVRRPTCMRCGKEIISGGIEYCYDCARHHRTFDSGMAIINYNELSSHSMAQIKYNNKREYLDFYAEAIYRKLGRRILRLHPDLLVPVPVHPSRLKTRGFNQAQELALILSEKLQIPVNTTLLSRSKNTLPQKALSPSERLENLEQAFISAPVPPGINTILLVDDIYTTGSTIEACSRVLKRQGAKYIHFVTIFIGSQR